MRKLHPNLVEVNAMIARHGEKWAPRNLAQAVRLRNDGDRKRMRVWALSWRKMRAWALSLEPNGKGGV
jgi:hypothetical protein